ncbi:hypothetical protein O71_08203 [Pontibacter sp. BAB1700]|nr:hypothetical protein O71_08203 [Pontibacter sp. BAB1700]
MGCVPAKAGTDDDIGGVGKVDQFLKVVWLIVGYGRSCHVTVALQYSSFGCRERAVITVQV